MTTYVPVAIATPQQLVRKRDRWRKRDQRRRHRADPEEQEAWLASERARNARRAARRTSAQKEAMRASDRAYDLRARYRRNPDRLLNDARTLVGPNLYDDQDREDLVQLVCLALLETGRPDVGRESIRAFRAERNGRRLKTRDYPAGFDQWYSEDR